MDEITEARHHLVLHLSFENTLQNANHLMTCGRRDCNENLLDPVLPNQGSQTSARSQHPFSLQDEVRLARVVIDQADDIALQAFVLPQFRNERKPGASGSIDKRPRHFSFVTFQHSSGYYQRTANLPPRVSKPAISQSRTYTERGMPNGPRSMRITNPPAIEPAKLAKRMRDAS